MEEKRGRRGKCRRDSLFGVPDEEMKRKGEREREREGEAIRARSEREREGFGNTQ